MKSSLTGLQVKDNPQKNAWGYEREKSIISERTKFTMSFLLGLTTGLLKVCVFFSRETRKECQQPSVGNPSSHIQMMRKYSLRAGTWSREMAKSQNQFFVWSKLRVTMFETRYIKTLLYVIESFCTGLPHEEKGHQNAQEHSMASHRAAIYGN